MRMDAMPDGCRGRLTLPLKRPPPMLPNTLCEDDLLARAPISNLETRFSSLILTCFVDE